MTASSEFTSTVVIAAANSWHGAVRMADRQLAEALSKHVPVLYVDPPTSFVTRLRRPEYRATTGRLCHMGPRLARLVPQALPGLTRRGVAPMNARLLGYQIRSAVRALNGTVHGLIDARVLTPVIGRCGESLSVYWAQDDFAGAAPLLGLSSERLRRGERYMAGAADVIVAANPAVADSIRQNGHEVSLIPFGCDYDHFSTAESIQPAHEVRFARPIAVFMGHVGDRIDRTLLERVVASGINLLVVGPQHADANKTNFDDLLKKPNVQWVGGKDFAELPAYLAHADVGILPYNHSAFNIGSFPLKTLEYLAAGLPVVASDLPAIRWLSSPDIVVADDPNDFADAVKRFLEVGRDPVSDGRRRAFAAEHSWDSRGAAFAEVIHDHELLSA